MMVFPKFFYSGTRHEPSDKDFIEKQLSKLSDINRKIICERYDNCYQTYFNQGDYFNARHKSNVLLLDFVKEFGVSKEEETTVLRQCASMDRFNARIEKLKKMRQASKPSIVDRKF